MTIQLNGKPSMAGHLHIKQPVDINRLVAVACGLGKSQPAFKDLHVRGGGDDGSYIVSFHFPMRDGDKDEFDMISELIREALTSGLNLKPKQMNWSIGSVVATI